VISFVANALKTDLEKFKEWENTREDEA